MRYGILPAKKDDAYYTQEYKTRLGHLQINVKNPEVSFLFYKDFFEYFEYEVISEGEGYLGFSNGTTDFWISATEDKYKPNSYHRKNTGLNHLCFRVNTKADVDTFCRDFLKLRNIPDSPKLFPEYTPDYYAVFFEDPDRIKLEVTFYTE